MGDKLMNGVMKWAVRRDQLIAGLMTGLLGSQIWSRLEFDITYWAIPDQTRLMFRTR